MTIRYFIDGESNMTAGGAPIKWSDENILTNHALAHNPNVQGIESDVNARLEREKELARKGAILSEQLKADAHSRQVGDSHENLTFHPLESGGVKHDQSKLPLDLLDPAALEGLTAVLQFGANKYAAHNWRSGFKWTRLIAAMLRHTFAIMRGELIDPESGLPHIDHVGCCWMFLSNMMKTRPDLNDIYKENQVNKT